MLSPLRLAPVQPPLTHATLLTWRMGWAPSPLGSPPPPPPPPFLDAPPMTLPNRVDAVFSRVADRVSAPPGAPGPKRRGTQVDRSANSSVMRESKGTGSIRWSFSPPMAASGAGTAASTSPPDEDASPARVARLALATPRGGLAASMEVRRPAEAGVRVAAAPEAAPAYELKSLAGAKADGGSGAWPPLEGGSSPPPPRPPAPGRGGGIGVRVTVCRVSCARVAARCPFRVRGMNEKKSDEGRRPHNFFSSL